MKSSFRFRLALILSLALYMIFPAGTALAAKPEPDPKYQIFLTSTNINGLTVELIGTGSADPYVGQFDQHAVKVDWDTNVPEMDPSVDLDVPNTFVDPDGANSGTKTFSGGWSASHTYPSSGTYKATIQLYHQNSNGSEGSVEAIITVGVVIPPTATVVVTKHVINDDGGTNVAGDFTLSVQGGNGTIQSFAGSESGTTVNITPGIFSVDEFDSKGYSVGIGIDCSGTIADGETKYCTMTNNDPEVTPESATLVVTKHVINDNGGTATAGDFTLNVTGTGVSTPSFSGSESGTTVTLTPGSYGVDEGANSGYTKTLGTDCSGTIANGETKYCTITNDDIAASLTVTKFIIQDIEGTADVSMFPLHVTNESNTQEVTDVTSGAATSFNTGSYIVSEDQMEGFTGSFPDGEGQDCDANGRVVLGVGETKYCSLVNTQGEPTTGTIIVKKEVINDDGGTKTAADFTMQVTATEASQTSFAGSASGVAVTVAPGSYSIDETADAGYAKTLGETCSGTIAAGDVVTCTITNDDNEVVAADPTLTVNKIINGGGYQLVNFPLFVCPVKTEQMEAGMTNLVATIIQLGPCNNQVVSGESHTYAPGQYKVSEIFDPTTLEPFYASSYSGDCDGTGNVTLVAGDTKTCTITNTYRGGGGGGPTGGGGGGGGGGGYIPRTPTPDDDEGEVLGVEDVNDEPTPTEPEEGEVLGEQACSAYLTEYIHIRKKNNPEEVVKLKLFLNEYMGVDLVINGDYDSYAFEAVLNFQKKEYEEVLAPWGIKNATGYVYKTTLRRINMLKCPELALPIPSPLVADTNIYDNF
jgi:hypothetical protein